MASLNTVLTDLTTEIRKKISALTPHTRGSYRFVSPDTLAEKSIEEIEQRARIFQVQIDTDATNRIGFACYDRSWKISGTIIIGYPPTEDWKPARLGDHDQIYDVLNQNDCTVTGVSYRQIPDDGTPTTEKNEDWVWTRLPWEAVVVTDI